MRVCAGGRQGQGPGGQSALHVVQDRCQSTPQCTVVLQKGSLFEQVRINSQRCGWALCCYAHATIPSQNHSHRKKRMRQIKKMQQRGLLDPEKEDPFALFVASTDIRYCYYSETHQILGNTYGMCVLQVQHTTCGWLYSMCTSQGGSFVVHILLCMS